MDLSQKVIEDIVENLEAHGWREITKGFRL